VVVRAGMCAAEFGMNIKHIMSKENVEKLLMAGGSDKELRIKYNIIETKEDFVATANADGYVFTEAELDAVLEEEEFDFASYGNPRTRGIWIR